MLLRQSPLIASPNPCPIPRNPRSYPISRILFSRCCFGTLRDRSLPSLQCCASKGSDAAAVEAVTEVEVAVGEAESREAGGAGSAGVSVGIGSPALTAGLGLYRMSLGDQAFFLLAFIACTVCVILMIQLLFFVIFLIQTSVAFTSLVVAAIPTLLAMRRTATSLARLADTATEELPSTMAAIRLSGMEISDLTLELTMIEERANLPNISLKPMVAGAARKTSHVVGKAKKTFMNIISGGEHSQKSEDMSDKIGGQGLLFSRCRFTWQSSWFGLLLQIKKRYLILDSCILLILRMHR
ncbi:unnamed protein product [Musa acuminata subsp. burmannicoides]